MLEEAAAQFAPKAAEKNITMTLIPTDATAVFDPKWTAEAVCNLLDNAVKYTPAGGSVTVQAVSYEMFCRVNGRRHRPRASRRQSRPGFSSAFTALPAAHQTEGVGIGLYLTRQIAEGQGGYIKVFSRPGGGDKILPVFAQRLRQHRAITSAALP